MIKNQKLDKIDFTNLIGNYNLLSIHTDIKESDNVNIVRQKVEDWFIKVKLELLEIEDAIHYNNCIDIEYNNMVDYDLDIQNYKIIRRVSVLRSILDYLDKFYISLLN